MKNFYDSLIAPCFITFLTWCNQIYLRTTLPYDKRAFFLKGGHYPAARVTKRVQIIAQRRRLSTTARNWPDNVIAIRCKSRGEIEQDISIPKTTASDTVNFGIALYSFLPEQRNFESLHYELCENGNSGYTRHGWMPTAMRPGNLKTRYQSFQSLRSTKMARWRSWKCWKWYSHFDSKSSCFQERQ